MGTSSGHMMKRRVMRSATVLLGRDEHQELVLRVQDHAKGHAESFMLRGFQLFTRFAKDGKCTMKLEPENTQVMISDCPPDRLGMFLRTLRIKHEASRDRKPVSDRDRLRAALPRSFNTVSPLQLKDVQKANELRSKVNAPLQTKALSERSANNKNAGGSQQVKRPRADCDTSLV